MSLNSLSAELVILVLKELSYREIVLARLVCRFWLQIINDSLLLRYLVVLGCYGKTEPYLDSRLTIAERLENITAHESRWRFLTEELGDLFTLTPKRVHINIYRLSRSILAIGKRRYHTKISFLRLPSVSASRSGQEWAFEDPTTELEEFGIDAHQDLLVVITSVPFPHPHRTFGWKVKLRSMSDGEPHKDALQPEFQLGRTNSSPSLGWTLIRITGDTLGILRTSATSLRELLIWNWKTGKLRAVLAINTVLAYCHNFDFLSEDSFVLPRASRPSDATTSVQLKAEIFVIQDSQGEDTPPYPTHVTSLLFPELSSSVCVFDFDVHTQSQERARNRNASSDAGDRIVSFNIRGGIRMDIMRGIRYCFVLYGESLISYSSPPADVAQLSHPSHPPTVVKSVPWSEWGAPCSRCFFDGSKNETMFFIHGHRFVSIEEMTAHSILIQVRDFRPSLVRRFQQSLLVGGSSTSEDSDSQTTNAFKPWPFDDSWPEYETFSLQLREVMQILPP